MALVTREWILETYKEEIMPDLYFLIYPEFCVRKLRLDEALLDNLQDVNNRERNHVVNWMISSGLTQSDFDYAGI